MPHADIETKRGALELKLNSNINHGNGKRCIQTQENAPKSLARFLVS
jgi:hypothetical protein